MRKGPQVEGHWFKYHSPKKLVSGVRTCAFQNRFFTLTYGLAKCSVKPRFERDRFTMDQDSQSKDGLATLQKVSVIVGGGLTASLYCVLRSQGIDPSVQDKFWCAIPFFSSMIVTDRCVIAKTIRHIKRMRLLNKQ